MIHIKDKSHCSGCHACYNICPNQCISMQPDSEGFWYPVVDKQKCISCKRCIAVCPILKPSIKEKNEELKVFAAYCKDDEIRLKSSSGGIFTLLAAQILKSDGVVFGAAFDTDFNVHHVAVKSIEELEQLRGSKYTQSKIRNSYKHAKEFLEQGKTVLFTGTPCQISGLYAFLGKQYSNLYTQDLICHGVPSPKVWGKYVKYREKCAEQKIKQVTFREKHEGWKQYAVEFGFNNKECYQQSHQQDIFMKGFLQDLYLRPSCHQCSFKGLQRQSDITLADFWGIEKTLPEMFDNKGTSLVLIHTQKGQKLWGKIQEEIKYQSANIDSAILDNSAAVKSVLPSSNRQYFFKSLNTANEPELFEKIVVKLVKPKLLLRLKMIIKRILHRLIKFFT